MAEVVDLSRFETIDADSFKKAIKELSKKFRRIDADVDEFLDGLKTIGDLGVSLGNGFYKARIANSDKNRGKSGGYRLIALLKVVDAKIYLVYIYDKSDLQNITEEELDRLVIQTS